MVPSPLHLEVVFIEDEDEIQDHSHHRFDMVDSISLRLIVLFLRHSHFCNNNLGCINVGGSKKILQCLKDRHGPTTKATQHITFGTDALG